MKYFIISFMMMLGMQLYSQQVTLTYDSKGNRTGKAVTGNLPNPSITGGNSICAGDSSTWLASGGVQYLWSNGAITSSVVLSPQQTTQFQLTAYAASGCAITIQRELVVKPLPSGYTISGDSIVNVGSTSVYVTAPVAGMSYNWQLGNTANTIISGSNTPLINIHWSIIPGIDSIMLFENNNTSLCTGKPVYKRVRIIANNVPLPTIFTAELYPNPMTVNSTLRIENTDRGPILINITNTLGQKIKEMTLSGAYFYLESLTESMFPSTGIYYLDIRAGQEQRIIKLVVQR